MTDQERVDAFVRDLNDLLESRGVLLNINMAGSSPEIVTRINDLMHSLGIGLNIQVVPNPNWNQPQPDQLKQGPFKRGRH